MTTAEGTETRVSISLRVEDIDIDICEYTLSSDNAVDEEGNFSDKSDWKRTNPEPAGPEYQLELGAKRENGRWVAYPIKIGERIRTPHDDILSLFESALLKLSIERQEEAADGAEHENNAAHAVDTDPYDPKKIRVDPKTFPVYQVYDLIEEGEIDLSPDFEREFVWTDIRRRSRLIESLLLRIPLPVFYLAQDEEGMYQVVDGVQRLTVIRDFLSNQFKLRDLEYLKDCNGKWFKDKNRPASDSLDALYVRRIEQTMLSFNVIDPQTPAKVKYDIFRRLNTGGKELNSQEIRNCFEGPEIRNFIGKLAKSEQFLKATRKSISSTRMADREVVLRFIAFYLKDMGVNGTYKNDMDDYLDKTVELLNRFPQTKLDEIERAFYNAMHNAFLLFGNNTFRKAKLINKALFLSWSRVLCKYAPDDIQALDLQPGEPFEALQKTIQANPEYRDALSKGTNDAKNLDICRNFAQKLLDERFKIPTSPIRINLEDDVPDDLKAVIKLIQTALTNLRHHNTDGAKALIQTALDNLTQSKPQDKKTIGALRTALLEPMTAEELETTVKQAFDDAAWFD